MAATPAPPKNAPAYTQAQVIAAITSAANKYGVPPNVLIASANEESGLNPNEPGGGLFQDIVGGEAGNSVFAGNPENVYNLQLSAENAAQTFASAAKANPGADWGTIAAKAQRPLNPTAYASAINSALGGSTANATLDSDVTTNSSSSTDTAVVPETTFAAPMKNADVKNFMGSGIDLSAIPANELGNAEADVQKYITNPGYAKQLQDRISQDYGYQDSWAQKIPELNGVLIWAASNLDLSTAAGKNQFQSAVSNTTWWKTTDANQRSWQQVQSSDPAQAHQALQDAQDKVLATANQIGVTLTKQQLAQIANTYASQTFVQSGALGSQSGTSQEWLDQAVVDTVLNVKKSGTLGTGTTVNQDFAGGTTDLSTATNPSQLTGISAQLYSQFQNIAQNYLLYDPANPTSGLLTDQDLMKDVNSALLNYTGSGSFGSSNLINGAVQSFTQQAMAQAKSVYPTLATAIDAGTTPSTYVAPLTNYVASQVGMASGQINVMDPQWNWLIASPGPTGVKGPVTQDQAMQKLTAVGANGKNTFSWSDPNGQQQTWDNTNTAIQTAHSTVNSLSAMFGTGGQ